MNFNLRLIIKLAYKNAFLRLSRTLLVIIMIAVSMSMMLSIQGIFDGMTVNMINAFLRSDSGEVSLYYKNYRLNPQINNHIKNATLIKKNIMNKYGVDTIALRYSVEGLSSTARKSSFSNIIGIDLEEEEKFGKFSDFLKEGELSFRKNGTLIGKELAKRLKVKIGSKVIFSTQDMQGNINSIALRVRGIIQTNNISIDHKSLYMDKKKLYQFLNINKNSATQIAMRTEDKSIINALKKEYASLDVKSFLELNPMLKQMKDMMSIFTSITFTIVMIVVFIGIMGVMYVSILDRIREFGIMRSIGMPYKFIQLQILLEAFFIGIAGYTIGATLGAISLFYLQNIGLDLSLFEEGLSNFGMPTILYAHQEIGYYTNTFYAIMIASLLSVILPLRKIKKLKPIEVIKVDK